MANSYLVKWVRSSSVILCFGAFGCAPSNGLSIDDIIPPDLPTRFTKPIPGAKIVNLESFNSLLYSGQLKVLNRDELYKDLIVSGSQVGLDALAIKNYIEKNPDKSSLLDDSLPGGGGRPKMEVIDNSGNKHWVLLEDNSARNRNIASAIAIQENAGQYHSSQTSLSDQSLAPSPTPDPSVLPQVSNSANLVSQSRVGSGDSGSSGSGTDSCALPTLLQMLDWPLKSHVPCIRNQGNRGTCTSFATAGAAEVLVHKKKGTHISLSQQGLYFKGKAFWPLGNTLNDGYNSESYLIHSKYAGFRIPFASDWKYNPSYNRRVQQNQFVYSCLEYGQGCSDTVHQGDAVCAFRSEDSVWVCGHNGQSSPLKGVQVTEYDPIWDVNNPQGSIYRAKLNVLFGWPVIVETVLTSQFTLYSNGFVKPSMFWNAGKGEAKFGSHAMYIVAFLSPQFLSELDSSTSVNYQERMAIDNIPGFARAAGEGFFVVANSWGTGWGDSGYIYVPESYFIDHAHGMWAVKDVEVYE